VTAFPVRIAPCPKAGRRELFALARTAFADRSGWDDLRVLDVLGRDRVFVARSRGVPAGYLALHREDGDRIVVDHLLVAGGHERQGVGHRLLEYAEAYGRVTRARVLCIAVEEDNRPARSFYRRSGFVPVASELFELELGRRAPAA
jgi:ribosomal protein S18 acetylase RimI-like enzyme